MFADLSVLGAESRIWVFPLSRALDVQESAILLDRCREFVSAWKAHGTPVHGGVEIAYHRFIVVAADEERSGVSGCSIDALFRSVDTAVLALGIRCLSASHVQYSDEQTGELCSVSRAEFQTLVNEGRVTERSLVFDCTLSTLAEYRAGKLQKQLRESWHANAFL